MSLWCVTILYTGDSDAYVNGPYADEDEAVRAAEAIAREEAEASSDEEWTAELEGGAGYWTIDVDTRIQAQEMAQPVNLKDEEAKA